MGESIKSLSILLLSFILLIPIHSESADFDFGSEKFNYYKKKIKEATRLSIEKERIEKINEFKEKLSGAPAGSYLDYLKDPKQIVDGVMSKINANRSSNCWDQMPKKLLMEHINNFCVPSDTANYCQQVETTVTQLNSTKIQTEKMGVEAALDAREQLMCNINSAMKQNYTCLLRLNSLIGSSKCLEVYDLVLNDTQIATIANSCTLESIDGFMDDFANEVGLGFGAAGDSFDAARLSYANSRKATIEMAKNYSVLTNYISQDLKTRAPASVECP